MTGPFETMIYTDCRAGEGLQGSAGLQFQACSPGASRAAMSFVQRHLLYEAPENWMRERRPPAEYPPSLAHTAGEFLATAAGVYLGREAAGRREGNHLTHGIVATDADSYGLVRPAQLFGAPFWRTRPAASTQCPALAAGWQPGPFDAVRAQRFVQSHGYGPDLLLALLSALQRIGTADEQRVLFVARRADDVLHWLTAATLLLPQERAVRIGFKVFTTNPAVAAQPVLATHPDWRSSLATVDNDLGYVVVDLLKGAWSEVAACPHAGFWVPRFLAEDVFSVVDAVEFAGACGLPEDQARTVALAAVLHQPPDGEAGAALILQWLRTGPDALVAAFGPALVEQVTRTAQRYPRLLLELDNVAIGRRLPRQVAMVRRMSLQMELDAIQRGDLMPGRISSPATWPVEDQQQARTGIEAALRTASPVQFDALLRLARSHGIPVSLANLREQAHAFVADWVQRPSHPYDIRAWAAADDLEDLLRQELNAAIQRDGGAEAGDRLGEIWEPRLRFREDLATPLDLALVAVVMGRLGLDGRWATLERCVAAVRGQGAARLVWLASVLFRRAVPTPYELKFLFSGVPNGTAIDQDIFRPILENLRPGTAASVEYLDFCREMVERGLLRPPPALREGLEQSRRLPELIRQLGEPVPAARETLDALRSIPDFWVAAHFGQIVTALVNGPAHPYTVLSILDEYRLFVPGYCERLCGELAHRGHPTHAVTAHFLIQQRAHQIGRSAELEQLLYEWVGRVPGRQIHQATELAKSLDVVTSRSWNRVLMQVNKPGLGGVFQWVLGRKGR
jgi:hypothetical protein